MHVDDFIDNYRCNSEEEKYARWCFMLFRLPASLHADFHKQIDQYKLFCTYQGKRYRVTGASRAGDVFLTKNPKRDMGYELRVNLNDCSEWSASLKKAKQ